MHRGIGRVKTGVGDVGADWGVGQYQVSDSRMPSYGNRLGGVLRNQAEMIRAVKIVNDVASPQYALTGYCCQFDGRLWRFPFDELPRSEMMIFKAAGRYR